MSEHTQPLAVLEADFQKYGCPYCGYESGISPISVNGAMIVICGECQAGYAVLAEGVTQSPIGFNDYHPLLTEHPRAGTPKHGRPDKQPEGGGEYFAPRGIGTDVTPGCFVCGGPKGGYNNISAFVQGKAAGERVVGMFTQGAWLDYREHSPNRVQVKVGACQFHLKNLQMLDQLTLENGIITAEMITVAQTV